MSMEEVEENLSENVKMLGELVLYTTSEFMEAVAEIKGGKAMNKGRIEEALELLAGIEEKDWKRIRDIVDRAFQIQKRDLERHIQLADFEELKDLSFYMFG